MLTFYCAAPQLAAWDKEPLQGNGGVACSRKHWHLRYIVQGIPFQTLWEVTQEIVYLFNFFYQLKQTTYSISVHFTLSNFTLRSVNCLVLQISTGASFLLDKVLVLHIIYLTTKMQRWWSGTQPSLMCLSSSTSFCLPQSKLMGFMDVLSKWIMCTKDWRHKVNILSCT